MSHTTTGTLTRGAVIADVAGTGLALATAAEPHTMVPAKAAATNRAMPVLFKFAPCQ